MSAMIFLTTSAILFPFCREKLDSSVNTDVLSEEAIVRESCEQSSSNCPGVGLIREIIPETVAMSTPECYPKENNPGIHELRVRKRQGDNCSPETHQDIAEQGKHEPVARTSILDEFI